MPAGGQVAAGLETEFVALLEAYLSRCSDCESRIQLGGIIQFVASTGGYVLSRSLRSRLSLCGLWTGPRFRASAFCSFRSHMMASVTGMGAHLIISSLRKQIIASANGPTAKPLTLDPAAYLGGYRMRQGRGPWSAFLSLPPVLDTRAGA